MDNVEVWVPVSIAAITAAISFVSGLILARHKAALDATTQYQLEARKRLYSAVGPLRYQLVVACRDASSRISQVHGSPYLMDSDKYYGLNTLYRLLRPLALSELLDRQTNYVDFGVDSNILRTVTFRTAAYAALTSDALFRDIPQPTRRELLNWGTETQHVFKGRLEQAASALIVDEPSRCARFDEFDRIVHDAHAESGIRKLANLLETLWRSGRAGQTFSDNADASVFWTRLVGYGGVCTWLVHTDGKTTGISPPDYPVTEMIEKGSDMRITSVKNAIPARIDALTRGITD